MIIELKSVSCMLDTENLVVFNESKDKPHDKDSEIHLYDCSQEWYKSLSEDDTKVVKEHLIDRLYKEFVDGRFW